MGRDMDSTESCGYPSPEGWGWQWSGCAEKMRYLTIIGGCPSGRTDLLMQVVAHKGRAHSMHYYLLVVFILQSRLKNSLTCVNGELEIVCFSRAILLVEAWERGVMECGRGDPEWHPEEHCHVGQICLIPLANICEMMEEECQHAQLSEYKQTVFNFFKSCLCCTIKTITATFVLWSRSISLLLGQDKLLVFLLLLKLPLSCMLLHIEDDFFFMPLSSSCVDVRIPLYIYIVQQHLCWIQLVFMVIFWYIAGMPLPSLLMTVPLCLTNK